MRTTELLAHLAVLASALGVQPPTKRMLRDWVDAGLIPPARAIGCRPQNWQYDTTAVEAAEVVLKLRSKGLKRASALRLVLWWRGFVHIPAAIALTDLKAEFRRLIRRRRLRGRFDYDRRTQKHLTNRQIARFRKQLGDPDPDLDRVDWAPTVESMLEIISEAEWGVDRKPITPRLIAKVVERVTGLDAGDIAGHAASIAALSSTFMPPGITGDPDAIEGSGEDEVKLVSETDLGVARERLLIFQATMRRGQEDSRFTKNDPLKIKVLKQFEDSLETLNWVVFGLGSLSIGAYRERVQTLSAPDE